MGREAGGFDPGSGFFDALRQDPVLTRVKLISEPWDLGPGGYQLGHHPPGFAEWNDRFRDSTRRFWRGDAGERPEFAARLAGSGDLFDRHARRPWASINYAASHDGFTLADLVSFAERHNEANGEDNKDGQAENYSANWGVEGPTNDETIIEIPRTRSTRHAGDRDVLRTARRCCWPAMSSAARSRQQQCLLPGQRDVLGGLDHGGIAEGRELTDFVAKLIALRQEHTALALAAFPAWQE